MDDFEQAAGKSGCEAIPYSSERGTCKSKQSNKDSVCKGFSCERNKVEKLLDTLKEKRKNLADAKSRNNQSAIPTLEAGIKDLEKQLTARKSEAKEKIDRCEDCIEARQEVQKVFAVVKSKVKGESDPALKPYIDKLVAHYEKGAQDHVKPLEEATTALTQCKWVSSISF